MYNISDEEIDFILNDLEEKGISDEDLRNSLLDHICIIIEDEMKIDMNFKKIYFKILKKFFNNELIEIQTETNNLLRFKHFYAMKKTLKITGLLTAVFTIFGAIFKTFHLPGAGVIIVLGGFVLSFIFLPLLIVLKFKDEDSRTDKVVFSFGFALAIILSAGLILKLMHWPTANILMLGSTVVFTFVYVPIYFFTRFNRPEIRFNTIVNSVLMLACGGIFFSLFDLSYSQSYAQKIKDDHHFMHDNSLRLFDSNDRLYASYTGSESEMKLHELSNKINNQLEATAASILEMNTTKHISEESEKLQLIVEEYNAMIADKEMNELIVLDISGLKVLDRFTIQMGLNTLARIQQQLAVNENCYLTEMVSSAQSL